MHTLNVLGSALLPCSYDQLTGYLRDGCCRTDETDSGSHLICTRVTAEVLEFQRALGNDLITPRPEWRFAGLKPGDRWCVCASRWRQALLATLRANRDHIFATLAKSMPGVRIEAPIEATYLAWLNVADLRLSDPIAHFEAHGVGLSDGAYFGAPRGHYVRLNFGCPRATLDEALRRMTAAVAASPGRG
jgi:uncharacterized protein (DUF2237 family)